MAISIIEYRIIRTLRERSFFPLGGDLLEVGEANWYGDVSLDALREDIMRFAAPERREALIAQLDAEAGSGHKLAPWNIAKIFWHTFLQPASITAIDYHGTDTAQRLDLNLPVQLGRQFHIVNNCGTLEHIFDIAQAFRNVHDLTLPGGLMIHQAPFVGWIDHGFYSLNPTLFFDLADANNYQVCAFLYTEAKPPRIESLMNREMILQMAHDGKIGRNANLVVVLRRPEEVVAFRTPMQGYYSGRVSQQVVDSWSALR